MGDDASLTGAAFFVFLFVWWLLVELVSCGCTCPLGAKLCEGWGESESIEGIRIIQSILECVLHL